MKGAGTNSRPEDAHLCAPPLASLASARRGSLILLQQGAESEGGDSGEEKSSRSRTSRGSDESARLEDNFRIKQQNSL